MTTTSNDKGPRSVTRSATAFTHNASPLDPVKLELGVVLALAPVVWLLAGRFVEQPLTQLGLLGGYGVAGMAWILLRARRTLIRHTGPGKRD